LGSTTTLDVANDKAVSTPANTIFRTVRREPSLAVVVVATIVSSAELGLLIEKNKKPSPFFAQENR